jgi:limonene-1,2-epoxide hydrolase
MLPILRSVTELASSPAGGARDQPEGDTSPTLVVTRFMELLRRGELDEAVGLLAVDVRYENVGLPTVHGRERVRRLFRRAYEDGAGFDVIIHTICADGRSVLTERTDTLTFRKLHIRLWVCGRFDVREGQIVLWRDYFDFVNFSRGLLRGMLGVHIPGLRVKAPSSA